METPLMRTIADAEARVSDKIRALHRAGFKKAEIARFLNRSYAQVHGVLAGDELKKARSGTTQHDVAQAGAVASSGRTDPIVESPRKLLRTYLVTNPSHDNTSPHAFTMVMEGEDILRLPAQIREALAAGPGDRLVAQVVGRELRIVTQAEALRRARTLVRRYLSSDAGSEREPPSRPASETRRD